MLLLSKQSLCVDWLAQYFRSVFALNYNDFTYGTSLTGSDRLFAALRSLFAARFHARLPVEPAHIIAGAGCGAVLDALCAVLADPGDGILVAKPMYPGFAASFGCRNGVEVVGVDVPEGKENSIEALEAFERTLEECKARGKRIRALVVCNPHNPLGFCYSREVLVEHCRFAEKHNLHLISDEIYALSTFGSHSRFTSLLSLDPLAEAGCSPSRLHVVYGASKDFGCNGLRIGVLVSQANPDVHVAIESSALLMKVSSAADMLWSSLLLDDPSLSTFLTLNLSRLRAAYARTVAFLTTHEIPFRPAEAGHFVWVDLTRYLPPCGNDMEREGALAERMWAQGLNLVRLTALYR
ncbi:hypothetical protein Rhopal_003314-T1 [Rhodotorula paludigena]|uniref:Aminotransferase class I/classII large domain-containing protein n=1 Tax=Rhodotorula paludigena TaxID=86838 RepID=A0AAV5GCM2_9BASI|nr:hypothetical protein Rhopal_003314-T1 [Rhodotorula paludigena]